MQYEHDDALRSQTRRAKIVKVDDTGSQQLVDLEGLKNEKPKKIFRPQDHGFTSNPPKDTEGVMIQMGGRSDRTLYMDGGHKDYRPKNTPVGGTVLYNHTGDVVRIVKDTIDITHTKNIKLSMGKGVKGEDDPISIVVTGNDITITKGGAVVKLNDDQISVTHPTKIVVEAPRINLGINAVTPIGLCGGGCATKVFGE